MDDIKLSAEETKQIRTEVLAAANQHIPAYQKAAGELRDAEKKILIKYHNALVAYQLGKAEGKLSVYEHLRTLGGTQELLRELPKQEIQKKKIETLMKAKPGELRLEESEYPRSYFLMEKSDVDNHKALSETAMETFKPIDDAITKVFSAHKLGGNQTATDLVFTIINDIRFPKTTKEQNQGPAQTPAGVQPQQIKGRGPGQ